MPDITDFTDPNDPFFPQTPQTTNPGVTYREYMIGQALAGLMARTNISINKDRADELAELAVFYVDAIFDYLDANSV